MKLWMPACVISMAFTWTAAGCAETDKFNITSEEHAACDGDVIRLCSDAFPDQDKVVTCMRTKRGQLSATCLPVFVSGMKKRHMRL